MNLSSLTDYDPQSVIPEIDGMRRVYITGNNSLPVQIPTDPLGNPFGVPQPVEEAPVEQPSRGSSLANSILGKLFGEGRHKLWPEKIVEDAITAVHDVKEKGILPPGLRREDFTDIPAPDMPTKDSTWLGKVTGAAPVAWSPADPVIEKAQAISALAGTGGLAGADATLGATPFLRPALKHKDRMYKGKPGQEHQDIIPDSLYQDFQKKAMSGEDLAEYNFGFINDKGHFLTREDALKYGIDTGLIDPHAGKFGALTTTLMADSSKPGTAIEAMAKTAKDWKIKGFEDYNDWFHGTTHTFDKFNKTKGNPENYLGKSPHFTNSSKDASANYAGFGPDLTSRIENLAENIAQKIADKKYGGEMGDNYGKIMTQAKQLAREKLAGEHEGAVVPVNLKLENPISTVDSRPTWLDFTAKYDKAGEWKADSPLLLKLNKSLEKQAEKYDFDPKKVMEDLGDNLYDEVKASDFDKALRKSENLSYAEDRKTGKLVSSDIISNIYKDLGFDGIVMDAKAAFPHMKDIPDGTLHAAPLKRNTVQSKITGQTLYANGKAYVLTPVDYEPEFK